MTSQVNAHAKVCYVDSNPRYTSVRGESWDAPAQSLQAAIDLVAAAGGGEVWVKAGVYKPDSKDREATFLLKPNVKLLGGFRGTESERSQRNPKANRTILSGNIGKTSDSDNCYHVVTGASGCLLDGFTGDEASILLQTVSEYATALDLLDDYDHQRVAIGKVSSRKAKPVSYDETMKLIDAMRQKFGDSAVFGKEKDQSLHSSLNAVMQSFDGKDVYPSVEEKAAHLLYFLVKNHSFVDGNKRIAAAVFLRFTDKNKLLYDKDGNKRIADNALVAMTLMIAESRPQEKAVITAMLTNLIGS